MTAEARATTADRASKRELVPTNEVLREITRGGLAGLLAGILVAGVGGRLVMRLAALLVPESSARSPRTGTGSATSRSAGRSR